MQILSKFSLLRKGNYLLLNCVLLIDCINNNRRRSCDCSQKKKMVTFCNVGIEEGCLVGCTWWVLIAECWEGEEQELGDGKKMTNKEHFFSLVHGLEWFFTNKGNSFTHANNSWNQIIHAPNSTVMMTHYCPIKPCLLTQSKSCWFFWGFFFLLLYLLPLHARYSLKLHSSAPS